MADYTDQQIKSLDSDIDAALHAQNNKDAVDDVRAYYGAQTAFRGYATDALEVVNDTDLFGLVANQELIDALGQAKYDELIPQVAVQLAAADDAVIQVPTSRGPASGLTSIVAFADATSARRLAAKAGTVTLVSASA